VSINISLYLIPATGDPVTGWLFNTADAHAKAGGSIAVMLDGSKRYTRQPGSASG
jgi:hypothetical protein